MDLGTQAILETGLEHLTGLFDGEGVGLAEDVAELGDALLLDAGHHLLADKADVLFAVRLVLRGDEVRAHEGRDEIHAVVIVEILDDLKCLELVLGGKTVAALGLDRGGAKAHHLVECLGGLAAQLLNACLAGSVGGGLNAAAGVLDLEIGLAVELHAQLVLAPAAEDEVGVGVDKAGGDKVAFRIDDLRTLDRGDGAGADGGDDAVLDEDPGVL